MVHPPDSDTDTGVLQGGTLTLYLLIICWYYVPWTSIDIMDSY